MIFVFPASHKFSNSFERYLEKFTLVLSSTDNEPLDQLLDDPMWLYLYDIERFFFSFLTSKWFVANFKEAEGKVTSYLHPKIHSFVFDSRVDFDSYVRGAKLMSGIYGELPGDSNKKLKEACDAFLNDFENGVIYE